MTTLLLVRHAHTAVAGRVLTGRAPGVGLTSEGREQAERLAASLAGRRLAAIVCSPLERARETAAAIARAHALPVAVREAWTELDFGGWTGRDIAGLAGDPAWDAWNARRGSARPPGGESMGEAQRRALADAGLLAREHPGGIVVVVTHAEIVRAVLLHALGAPLDDWASLPIEPASVHRVELRAGAWRVPDAGEVASGRS